MKADEDMMPVVILLCGMAVSVILFLIGLMWLLSIFAPAYFLLALIGFYLVRRRHQKNALRIALAIEAERQRALNNQEYRAWQSAVNEGRERDARRKAMLRRFDSTRN